MKTTTEDAIFMGLISASTCLVIEPPPPPTLESIRASIKRIHDEYLGSVRQ